MFWISFTNIFQKIVFTKNIANIEKKDCANHTRLQNIVRRFSFYHFVGSFNFIERFNFAEDCITGTYGRMNQYLYRA